jgi:hypothetical protein
VLVVRPVVHKLATCAELAGLVIGDLRRNDTVHDLGRIRQRIAGEVSITLRRARVCMTEQSLHDVERHTFVNKEAGKRMSQVVKSYIL